MLRATGNAMSTPVVAAAFKRCMVVLAARMSMGVPSTIPPPDEERERRRIAIKLMREHIALLEAQESVLRRMSQQGEIRVERLQKTVGGSRRTNFKVTGFGAAWLTEV